jgi:hypothetical protein
MLGTQSLSELVAHDFLARFVGNLLRIFYVSRPGYLII